MINLLMCIYLMSPTSICDCNVVYETPVEQQVVVTDSKEFNEIIVDNYNVKVTLLNMIKTNNDGFEEVKFKFDVENKTDSLLGTDAKFVSSDGVMIDEAIITMMGDIESGKKGTVTLNFIGFEGYDLPTLKENLEFTLYLFSWKNVNYEEEIPVAIEI